MMLPMDGLRDWIFIFTKNLISTIVAQLGFENQGHFLFGMLALSLLGLTYNATVSNRTDCMCMKI